MIASERRERRPRRDRGDVAGEAARLGLGAPEASASDATAAVVIAANESPAPIVNAAPDAVTTPVVVPTPLSLREPLPAPGLPPQARGPSPTTPPERGRPVTIPPPDPIDQTWDEPGDAAAAPEAAAPEASPPASGEMASDGAAEGDGIDSGWD